MTYTQLPLELKENADKMLKSSMNAKSAVILTPFIGAGGVDILIGTPSFPLITQKQNIVRNLFSDS